MLNIQQIKQDFPIFKNHPRLVYLDSTATSLKPQPVIDKLAEYYRQYTANIFRGIYKISEKATAEYEETRETTARFINAFSTKEVIFTRNTTESLNLLAYSLGRQLINQNDEIVTSIMEHHSNFVPWQVLAVENGGVFKIIDIDGEGELVIGNLREIINKRTKILSLTYVSNVLGTINPIKEIIKLAKQINPGIITVIDAAQAIPHFKIDVQDLGCDFLAFSSHKMLGPTGIGVLWGKEDLLQSMFPFQYGGEMVSSVSINKTTYKDIPLKFEAGTPDIAGVSALKASIRYLEKLGWQAIACHEKTISEYAYKALKETFGSKIKILGPSDLKKRSSITAFTFGYFHPHDIAQILDDDNICIRAGHHCAMPLHERLGIPASARASFYIYNDKSDVDKLIAGLEKVEKTL